MSILVAADANSKRTTLIEDVKSGLSCNCVCASCGATLVAKKGQKNRHHFAHYESDETAYCRETALHLAAKEILLQIGKIQLPLLEIESNTKLSLFNEPYSESKIFFEEKQSIRAVKEEIWLENGGFRPDIKCEVEIEGAWSDLIIEIAVTHKVEINKEKKVEKSDLNAIEIDLASLLKISDLSLEDIRDAILDVNRMKWVNKSSVVLNILNELTEDENRVALNARNAEITNWHKKVSQLLLSNGEIKLPDYRFPDSVQAGQIRDDLGRFHSTDTPSPPVIGGTFKLKGISEITDCQFDLLLERNNREHVLPVLLITGNEPNAKPTQSFLKVNVFELPPPAGFCFALQWGKSIKAEQWIERINNQHEQLLKPFNQRIEHETKVKLQQFADLKRDPSQAVNPRLKLITGTYYRFLDELQRCNIEPTTFTTSEIANDWIFGCPYQYWQIIIFRSICYIDNEDVELAFYHKFVKKNFAIDAIEPIRSLRFIATATDIPTAWKVISDYFAFLKAKNVLLGRYKGYRKNIPYGARYKAMIEANNPLSDDT